MELKPEDLVMNNWSGVRKSGWSVTPDNGVSILHRPTGAMVQVDTERSQHANKAIAMKMLEAKVETLMEERARPPAPSAAAGGQVPAPKLTQAELSDPEFMQAYVDECYRVYVEGLNYWKNLAAQPTPAQGGKEGA